VPQKAARTCRSFRDSMAGPGPLRFDPDFSSISPAPIFSLQAVTQHQELSRGYNPLCSRAGQHKPSARSARAFE
jgi:hypothetical protein